ncbi:MAG: proline--tRNA ligase [Rickettsiales bacterium]
MKISNLFIAERYEYSQKNEAAKSAELIIKAGLADFCAAGLYSFLPIGVRVLNKITQIIKMEHDNNHINEIIMPIVQPAELWQESGRLNDYGKEMLTATDRHNKKILIGPTAEEIVTDIFRKYIHSYKNLPVNLYQINWKFRDEIRPRFGIMRAREFLMKDAYSFDLNAENALITYKKFYRLYLTIFKKLGLTAIPVRANSGEIGGNLSHEFHILAETGESKIYAEANLIKALKQGANNYEELNNYYAAADELHNEENAKNKNLLVKRGIEVGHIFNFADKYAKPFQAKVTNQANQESYVNMGSYGIGVTRLLAAIIESSHDEKGIIWPEIIAPFQIIINPLNIKDNNILNKAENIYHKLQQLNIEVLLDDSDKSIVKKFASHDLLGIPKQIIIGAKNAQNNLLELKHRQTGLVENLTFEQIINKYFNI